MSETHVDLSQGASLPGAAQPQSSLDGKAALPLVLAVVAAILLGMIFIILRLNDGTFLYTMDDPYIGLAFSDQIRHGNYGMNPGIPAAPDSSILYPLLCASASGTPIHPYLPLILNTLALFATLIICWRLFTHLRLASDNFGIVVQAVALLLLALCLNLVGVVFSGLEHNLHIAAVAATVYGVALLLDKGKMPAWLPAVIVVSPLLRFEGLALSFAALLILALRGHWRTAAASFALMVLFVGGFSAFLVHLGLPPLPSSVLTKSALAASGVSGAGKGFLFSIAVNVDSMIHRPVGALMLCIGVAAAVRCCMEPRARLCRWSSQALMALLLVCLIGAHAVAGRFGWMDRYEDYAMLGTALIGVYLTQATIRNMLSNKKKRLLYSCAAAIFLVEICSVYLYSTWKIPLAANNIYEQHFQMHRFVNDFYRAPVAVNDLGLVSYHNPNFVLDLGGLASEKARLLIANGADADDYRELVESSNVHLVIIYDDWFSGQVPDSWIKVASMDLSRERISSAEAEVQFYSTDASSASKLLPELQAFRKSLPPRIKLTIYSPAAGS
jgi:hypothetical protein